jgi:heme/copper-type cytochrome/quinol oxidase subunit 3
MYAQAPQMVTPRKHSGLGIAGVVLALCSFLPAVGVISYCAYQGVVHGADWEPDDETATVIGGLVCLTTALVLAGAALSFAGLFARERKKTTAVVGLILNCLVLLIFTGLTVIGLIIE